VQCEVFALQPNKLPGTSPARSPENSEYVRLRKMDELQLVEDKIFNPLAPEFPFKF